jgi:60 kDa SS-A/Ro ribonucleoprotein
MADALSRIVTRPGHAATPQSGQADERQVPNSAGGWAFTVPGAARVMRFLTLGTDGGTYYVSEQALTKDNAAVILDWARNRTAELVTMAAEVSVAGRAPRNNPALFAIAACAALGDAEGRRLAMSRMPEVARTGTHLFTFVAYLEQFRGWGRTVRRGVAGWYLGKDPDDLAYQLVKYRQREGWTHLDVLRSIRRHITDYRETVDQPHRDLFNWLARGVTERDPLPRMIEGYQLARDIGRAGEAGKTAAYSQLIRDYPGLPWEALPDETLSSPETWRALLDNGLPQGALLRQLPRLTRLGVLDPLGGSHLAAVCAQLKDPARLLKARVHPVAVLIAAKTYAAGQGKGSSWTPVPQVTQALSDAFYAAFAAVEPSGKRTLLALDISGSMTFTDIAGLPVTPREVTAAMSLVTMATEPSWGVYGFSTEFMPLQLSPGMRLDQALRHMNGLPFGGTDCSLPMLEAARNRWEIDTFQCYTDNETWAGRMHPHEALEAYRQQSGIPARLQVIAVTSTGFSIADPEDAGSLDVAGFDAAVPRLLADHARGDI